MDQAMLIYILLAFVVIVPIVGVFLRRKARRAGADRVDAKKGRQAGDDGLGATLTFAADEATVRPFVDEILTAAKRVKPQQGGTWAQTHYNDDDIVYQLTPIAGGTLLAISRAIEFSGTLNGMKQWKKLREQLVATATERGITTTAGSRQLVRTGETGPSGALIWRTSA